MLVEMLLSIFCETFLHENRFTAYALFASPNICLFSVRVNNSITFIERSLSSLNKYNAGAPE